jgi:hypothetical protein
LLHGSAIPDKAFEVTNLKLTIIAIVVFVASQNAPALQPIGASGAIQHVWPVLVPEKSIPDFPIERRAPPAKPVATGVGFIWADANNFSATVTYAIELGDPTTSAPDRFGRFGVQLVKDF